MSSARKEQRNQRTAPLHEFIFFHKISSLLTSLASCRMSRRSASFISSFAGIKRSRATKGCAPIHLRCFSKSSSVLHDSFSSSSSSPSSSLSSSNSWRKAQLEEVENKFSKKADEDNETRIVEREEDLQQMWRDMESRVTRRKTLTAEQRGGKVGRRNIRRTDEDTWLDAGLYNKEDNASKK